MKNFLKEYSETNPEKFNKEFILSRDNPEHTLEIIQSIFKSLEILPEIKIKEVRLETDESDFGPIRKKGPRKKQGRGRKKKEDDETEEKAEDEEESSEEIDEEEQPEITVDSSTKKDKFVTLCYKAVDQSRLNRIYYKIFVRPDTKTDEFNEEFLNERKKKEDFEFPPEYDQSNPGEREKHDYFYTEGYIYLNKLLDGSFFINEGIRYYLIYQIVDNSTYAIKNTISLKSLLMPISLSRDPVYIQPEFRDQPLEASQFSVLLFSKKVNPMVYFLVKESYNSLVRKNFQGEDRYLKMQNYYDPEIIERINKFFKINLKISEKLEDHDQNNLIFKTTTYKEDQPYFYISVSEKDFKEKEVVRSVLGSLLNIPSNNKKKTMTFSYNDLIRPWFWIDLLAGMFSNSAMDAGKKLKKVKNVLISLERLIDDSTFNILQLPDEDKENALSIMRYIMKNYTRLSKEDPNDLDEKRLRLDEYLMLPLQIYFSNQIYRVLGTPMRSEAVLQKIFSNLNGMGIIKAMVVNELLRYYNSPNEIDLFTSLLKYTFTGQQSISGKNVSMKQRDIHPSFTGRLSLIDASASNPGLSGNLTPFCEVYGKFGFFNKKYDKKNKLKE